MQRSFPFISALSALLVLAIGLTGCDSLTENPQTSIDPANYYENAADVETAVNGIYSPLVSYDLWKQPAWSQVVCEGENVICPNWMPDNQGTFAGPTGGEWFSGRPWIGYYNIIGRANALIANVQAMDEGSISESVREAALGQAYFLRGYAYFELARNYGPTPDGTAPIRLEPYDPTSQGYGSEPRAPARRVYGVVVADMRRAADLLPGDYASGEYASGGRGRPTAPAAMGMLSKIYLFMAGAQLDGTDMDGQEQAYYDSSRTAAQQVMDRAGSGFPSLESFYADLFDQATQDESDEMLFTIQLGNPADEGGALAQYFSPPQFSLAGGGGQGFISIRPSFVESFPAGDLRAKEGDVRNDSTMIATQWITTESPNDATPHPSYYVGSSLQEVQNAEFPFEATEAPIGYAAYTVGGTVYGYNTYATLPDSTEVYAYGREYTTKYIDQQATGTENNGANPIILRYAEVLLNFAEAENEVNGPTSAAYNAVNRLRERADAPDLTPGLGQDAFRDSVWAEREFELYAEFHRRYDLIRQGRYLDVLNSLPDRSRTESQKRFPLPDSEINANDQINSNNPGY